jgi:lipopolysaccharide transport system ATP-binding protein
MTDDVVIRAEGLGKRYRLGAQGKRHNSLRDALDAAVRGLTSRSQKPKGEFWALRNASFEIKRGENVGIIGLNGAGKSTLLKILSRIVTPTEGEAMVKGRLGALLEVGTGFHRELTGRENIFLYGSILGMEREEVAAKFERIAEFSEIEKFLDTPVKHYSSGMYVRLAFAVAAHLDPDILLLDEVLAVGDFLFQKKCLAFARSLEQRGSTILFVSHNMLSIKTMCPRVIYLRKGEVVFDGPTDEGLGLYERDSQLSTLRWFHPPEGGAAAEITNVELFSGDGRPKTVFDFGERLRIRISYRAHRAVAAPNFLCTIRRSDETFCCNFSSAADGAPIDSIEGEGAVEILTQGLCLVSDRYRVEIVIRQRGFESIVAAQTGASFHVRHDLFNAEVFGVFHERAQWTHGEISLEQPTHRPGEMQRTQHGMRSNGDDSEKPSPVTCRSEPRSIRWRDRHTGFHP